MAFKDHFSRQSAAYSRHRPSYPRELIAYIAARAPRRACALDCATGNGQAAIALAEHFDAVLAVDGSLRQLAHAESHARVRYAAALAERLPARNRSIDLVAAAQAAHWFDLGRFHAECRRVLAPGGVVALWTYGLFRAGAAFDEVIDDFCGRVVGSDWPPERRHVEQAYRTLPFPWVEEATPAFELVTDWDLGQVLGYVGSWSAVQRCRERTGRDPLDALRPLLAASWPPSGTLRLRWPLHLRLGRT